MCSLGQNLALRQTGGVLLLSQFAAVWDSSTFVECVELKNSNMFIIANAKLDFFFSVSVSTVLRFRSLSVTFSSTRRQ